MTAIGILAVILSTGCYVGADLLDRSSQDAEEPSSTSGGDGETESGGDGEDESGGDSAQTATSLRLLTQAEYRNSVHVLFDGLIEADPRLSTDLTVAGFASVGAAELTVREVAAELYEDAARDISARLFADEAQWQPFVGCEPAAGLNGSCTTDFIQAFGHRAFRRPLTAPELEQWSAVAKDAAALTRSLPEGLATAVSGMLQSPYFLYRVETSDYDPDSGRQRYDGLAMATRLAFVMTGATPTDEVLAWAERGDLDTAEGVREAAIALLASPAAQEHLGDFFLELAHVDSILEVDKDEVRYPEFDEGLAVSMLEETRTWLRELVLAPGADVRAYFDSRSTYVDERLAELYGLPAPQGAGFVRVELPPETGRAGILGHASFLSRHASPESSAPTRRGFFITSSFLCVGVPPPPADIETELEDPGEGEGPVTTRQRYEQHVSDPSCAGCHNQMDPLGFALEHFDAIGRYRADEYGIPINAVGEINGTQLDGALELAAWIRDNPQASQCLIRNFYRYANGSPDEVPDRALIEELNETFAGSGHVWQDLLVDFVSSEAFRSAPTQEASP